MKLDTPKIALIGVPTDIGAGHRGSSMGPEAMRVAGIAEALRSRGLEVHDYGNLQGPVNPWQPLPRRAADYARWRPLPRYRLDYRSRPPLPRNREKTLHPVARCAR